MLGIVSERGILSSLAKHGAPMLGYEVGEVMVVDVPNVVPKDLIQRAMATMTNAKVRHLPVIDNGMVTGLISIGDVVKSRLEEKTQENEVLQDLVRVRECCQPSSMSLRAADRHASQNANRRG